MPNGIPIRFPVFSLVYTDVCLCLQNPHVSLCSESTLQIFVPNSCIFLFSSSYLSSSALFSHFLSFSCSFVLSVAPSFILRLRCFLPHQFTPYQFPFLFIIFKNLFGQDFCLYLTNRSSVFDVWSLSILIILNDPWQWFSFRLANTLNFSQQQGILVPG